MLRIIMNNPIDIFRSDYAGYWYNYGGEEGQLAAKVVVEATILAEIS